MKHLPGLVLLAATILTGCSLVTSDSPIASETSKELQNDLRGVWRCGDSVVHLEFDSAGRGVFASVEWDEDKFAQKQGELFAREVEDWKYVSAKSLDEKDKDEGYVLGAFKRLDSGDLVVWPALGKAFRALVDEGKIEGEISGTHAISVRVTDGAKLLELIDKPRDFFDLENPIIFRSVFPDREKN